LTLAFLYSYWHLDTINLVYDSPTLERLVTIGDHKRDHGLVPVPRQLEVNPFRQMSTQREVIESIGQDFGAVPFKIAHGYGAMLEKYVFSEQITFWTGKLIGWA